MVLTLPQLGVFLLILARVAGIFIQAPVFNSRTFPASAKTALAIWISAVLWFAVPVRGLPDGAMMFLIMIFNEVIIGFLIGFICQILFAVFQAAGDLMDLQMGLSIATALDPNTGAVSSVVGKLAFYLGLVVFLIINGHHMIISAVHQSFRVLPAGAPVHLTGPLVTQLIELGAQMLLVSVQLAVPALLIIFLSDFSFGIVSRVAPQVNVFMLGFQVKPSLGMIAFLLSTPLIIGFVSVMTGRMMQEIVKLFAIIK